MRRRKNSSPSSGNLLLDTLCNTLGGVIFIALLVALLPHQMEIGDTVEAVEVGEISYDDADWEAVIAQLQATVSSEVTESRIRRIRDAVDQYRSQNLRPASTEKSLRELTVDRRRLRAMPRPEEREIPTYEIPGQSLKQSRVCFVLVKDNELYVSGIVDQEAVYRAHRETQLQENMNLYYDVRGATLSFGTVEGYETSEVLQNLIHADLPSDTAIHYYVHPSGIELFQEIRGQIQHPHTARIPAGDFNYSDETLLFRLRPSSHQRTTL